MSQENVELVRAAVGRSKVDMLEMFGGDVPPSYLDLSVIAEDVEIVYVPALDEAPYRGIAGLVESWRDWLSAWSRYDAEIEDFIDAGDRVVMFVHLRGETRHDHVVIEQPAAVVYTLEAGKVVRLAFHLDRRIALEEAGRADLLS